MAKAAPKHDDLLAVALDVTDTAAAKSAVQDAPDNWAECVRIIGTVVLDHGPTTAAFRSDPDEGTSGEVIISVRQIEGDSPIVEVEWPDSTADFPGVETWTPREARQIGGYMVQAAGLLDGSL